MPVLPVTTKCHSAPIGTKSLLTAALIDLHHRRWTSASGKWIYLAIHGPVATLDGTRDSTHPITMNHM